MARSHAVWVVIDGDSGEPLAAFTVKHELKTWVTQQGEAMLRNRWIWRLADGVRAYRGRVGPQDVSAEFLL